MKERRRAIVELVNKMSSVSIAQLKEAFPEVSEMTIRNDIKALDREHKLVRVYGGVRSLEFAVGADGLFDVRRNQNVDAKAAIAAKAAKLVRPNTTIYLDSGSTLAKFAAALPDEHLMVFTCGIYNVMELGHFDTVDVIVPGGTLNVHKTGNKRRGAKVAHLVIRIPIAQFIEGTYSSNATVLHHNGAVFDGTPHNGQDISSG